MLSQPITDVLIYIIDSRDFPECWAEGIRSAIYKSGGKGIPENYRGITILPVLEFFFEIAVYKRIGFVNEPFCKIDPYNGGFLEGRRTADNWFIIHGHAQRQMILNKNLILCFVDFSKAFDMVDRNILFYKMIKCGWHGKVKDTLRSLYTKTKFRVKYQGWLSHLVNNVLGVNQGGVASGSFLTPEYGICIEENIIAHILWADDLVSLSDSEKGMQNQFDGLLKFCSLNLMSVNEIKTKSMVIGNKTEARVNLTFNKKDIEQVNQYKCIGVIVCLISRNNEDIFACNYPYLCDQGRKALFGVLHRLRSITPILPRVQFKLFDAVIKPILIYGSDVWGHNKSGTSMIDKVMLRFSRCVLNVKATTSNVMVYGEGGILPPSVYCTVSTMCYMNRLHHMPNNSIVKQVYNELFKLHQMGFVTWVTRVGELVETYSINIDDSPAKFKSECKRSVFGEFTRKCTEDVQNIQRNRILRTYCKIKQDFGMERYLKLIKNHKYRTAMTQLRTSSHTLAIEYGRYTHP